MDRYKVDRLENGRKIAEKYLGTKENNVEKTKSKEMSNDRLENGKRLYEKYSGNNLMNFAREYAAQKTQRVPVSAGLNYRKTGNETKNDTSAKYNGKYGSFSLNDARKTTDYQKYVDKGSGDLISGYSDDVLGKLRTAAKSLNPNIGLRARNLTDEEKEMYNFLLGKYGREEADAYEESLSEETSKRMTEKNVEEMRIASEKNPIAGVGINVLGSLQASEGYLRALADEFVRRTIERKEQAENEAQRTFEEAPERSPMSAIGVNAWGEKAKGNKSKETNEERKTDVNGEAFLGSAIEEASRRGVKDRIGGTPTKDFFIDTGMSMAQNIGRLPLGSVGLAVAGLGAATGGYKDAIEKGGTNNQALAAGAAQGAAEAFFEKYSLEGLESMQAVPVKRARDIFKNLLKQSVTEGSEEAATELANAFSDNIIMGELSDFNQNYKRYMEMGLSEEEAIRRANVDLMKNIGLSAAGGALSGGIMGGGAMALGGIETNYENRQKNQLLIDPEDPTRGGTLKDLYLGDMAREFASMYGANNEEIETENQPQEPLYSPENQPKTNNTEEYLTEDKNTVETSNNAKETERNLAKDIFSTFGKNGMEAAADNYDGSIGMLDYQRAFGRYYDAGRHNGSMETAEKSPITAILSKEQANAAFEAGKKDWELEQSQIPEFRQGEKKEGVLIDQSKNATRAQKQFLEKVGKNTGMKIVLVDNLESGAVAEYQNGTIRISTNSKNFLGTASHEITHFIKEYGGEGYRIYRDYAVNALMNSRGVSMERMIESYQKTYEDHGQNLSREEVIDEIVADATEAFFNDEEFIKKVARKDHNLAEKMVDFLSDIIDAVRELINTDTRRAAKALSEDLNKLELARETWIEAMGDAGEKYKSGLELVKDEGTKFSLEKPELVTKERIEENFEKVRNMNPVVELTGKEFEMGGKNLKEKIKSFFESVGGKAYNSIVGEVLLDKRAIRDDVSHGLGVEKVAAFKAVPDVIREGNILDHQLQWKGRKYDSVTIGAKVKIGGKDYYELVIVKVTEKNRLYVHEVHMAETGQDTVLYQTRSQKGAIGGYPDPNTETGEITPFGTAKSGNAGGDNLPSINSIFKKLVGVNREKTKNAGRGDSDLNIKGNDQIDSDGNKLSEGQKEYFKDSKVRDENGNLMVMYHGTPNSGFTEFRPGTYFTKNKWYADVYHAVGASAISIKKEGKNPDTYKVYLDIKKPFDTRIEEVRKLWYKDYYRKWGTGTDLQESGLPDWTDGEDIREFIEENELDFDGIVLDEGGFFDEKGEVKKRGISYVVMRPEQVKNVTNMKPTENKDIRFQLEDPVEETKELIAVHNITSDKLLKTLKLEGIPMPSIAVTKAELGHENFGDISLLFKKDTIDPKKKKNKVYSADAWTPTFPAIDYEVNTDVYHRVRKDISNIMEGKSPDYLKEEAKRFAETQMGNAEREGIEGVIESARYNIGMKAAYLASKGIEVKDRVRKEGVPDIEPNKEAEYKYILENVSDEVLEYVVEAKKPGSGISLKEIMEKYGEELVNVVVDAKVKSGLDKDAAEKQRKNYKMKAFRFNMLLNTVEEAVKYKENGIKYKEEIIRDIDGINKEIESKIDEEGFEDWIRRIYDGLITGKGVDKGEDPFTTNGNRKKFSQTHLPVTAKNIVKAMMKQGEKNTDGFFTGIKNLRAVVAEEYGSIEDIKKESGRISTMEEYEDELDRLNVRMENVMLEIGEQNGMSDEGFVDLNIIGRNILEAAENPTVENIKATLKQYRSIITDSQAREIADIIQAVKEMPVNMFEAKPQRVVGYDEIAAAVVPETKTDAIDALEEKGIRVITYDKNVDGARKEAVNSVEGIRFQLDEFDVYIDVEDLIEENTRLQEVNKKLSEQLVLTKKYKPRREDISKFAGEILKTYNSSYSKKTLTDNLSRLYEHMRNTDRLDMNEVSKVAADIGRGILNKARQEDTEDTKYNEKLLSTIRETKIKVPMETKADLSIEGGYSAFKKKYFRKLSLSENGIGVDVAYEQLSGQYPDLFPKSFMNPTDQLFRIAEVVDEAKPKIENPYGADIDELSVVLGQELLDYRVNIRSMAPTLADKLFERADREEERYRAARKEYEAKMKDYKKTLWERDGVKTMKKQIIRDVTKMQTWLTKPNDKEHVPEQLRTAVAKFLSCIDYSTDYTNQFGEPTKRTLEWESVQKTYEAIIARGNIVDDTYVDIDVNIADNIKILLDKVEGIERLDDLDFEGIKALRDTVAAMKKSITDVNLLHSNRKYAEAQKCGKDSFEQISKRKEKWVANGFKNIDKLMNTEMLDSFSFFERMGSVAYSVFDELRRGFDKKIEFTQITEQYFSELKEKEGLTQKDIRDWGENAREFEVEGGVLKFTPAEIMSLYELTKRPQARKHIFNGLRGIRTRNVNIEKEIRLGDKKVIGIKGQGTTKPVNLSEADAQKIIATLTPQQKRVADGITKFFVEYTGAWGNEVSMLMFGYKKFNDANYFPITVDRDEIATTSESQQQTRTLLKNLGMTKSVVRDAKNAIIIDDIFDVFTRHADQMGSYSAFVPALSDFQKYYNYNDPEGGNLKTKIQEVFGKEALSYIEDLLIDINGGGNKEAGLTAGMLRNVKSAAVGANIRTVVQQPTAYMRAVMEIDPKYLAKGLKKAEKGTWEECKRYAPIAQWKDWGFFDISTGRSMRSIFMGPESLREKAIEFSMAAAGKGDEIAWTHLWMAVKEETRDLHPELKGEEFYKYCGERFSYIIDRTQVVDSVFHRSRAMKRKGWDIYTAFMSEPTKSYNMLYRAVDKLVESKQITGKFGAEEKKKLGRAVAAYALTGLLTSVAAAVWDTARDDDDEKLLWEKYVSNLIANVWDNLNPVNMIPVAKDIWSIFYGYSSNRMDLQAMQQLKYAYNELENYILGKSKFNFGGVMRKWLKPVSMLTGVPVDNAVREVNAAFNLMFNIGEEFGPEYSFTMDYKKDSFTMPMSSEKNTTMYVKKALKAYSLGKKNAGDKILKELRKAGIKQNDIDSKISENIKGWSDVDDAADLLMKGDLKGYEEAVNEIYSVGIDKESVIKAIRSKVDKIKKDEEEETEEETEEEEEEKKEPLLYRGKDIRYAIDAGNSKTAEEIIDYLYKKKRESGRSANEAKSDIKSSLTGQYKKLYLSSGHDKRKEIRTKLENIRVNGTQIFHESDFTKWIDSEKKKK